MLQASNVSKIYKKYKSETVAVKNVNFSLENGEFCALVGESGSGKSTFSRLLCGIISPDGGTILLDGKSIMPPARRKDKTICSKIQLVLQDGQSALDPMFTVFNCIAEPLKNLTKLSKKEISEKVYSLIEKMGLPKETALRKPKELSGGQQKRVCIARALATDPQIIIFDEAISGLDVLVRQEVLELIKELHSKQNASYLFITHDMDVALYLANRIIVMKDGEFIEERRYNGDVSCFTHPYTKLLLEQMLPIKGKKLGIFNN